MFSHRLYQHVHGIPILQFQNHPSIHLQLAEMGRRDLLPVFLMLFLITSSAEGSSFKDIMMYSNWGFQRTTFQPQGQDATLILDQVSGSGIESNDTFLFGSFEMHIKLAHGNTAGTVTAFYLSSVGDHHDEIDFEFLGNVSGQPYTIHTNVFTQGGGGREQQFLPWYDPTAQYHNYTIRWSDSQIVWYVDSVPIRVYNNYMKQGILYPQQQRMRVYSSIWNADSWATRGGDQKIDWSKAPFVAKLRHFKVSDAGKVEGPVRVGRLEEDQKKQMTLLRSKYMIYDFCQDFKRFRGLFPGECFMPQY